MQCIKNKKCSYYFESDDFEKCTLVNKIIVDKCVGLTKLRDKKESVVCKISKLQQELDYLMELPLIIGEGQK